MPRKAPKHPDRVAEHRQEKERRRAADLATHSAQLAAALDQVSPLPGRQSHFRDALAPADDPNSPSPLQLRAEQQIRAIDKAIDALIEAHRNKTLLDVALELKKRPLHPLSTAGLVRRVIELSDQLDQPKQAATIRHAGKQAAMEWVRREWEKRGDKFTSASHFASSYATKVLEKFGVTVGRDAIRKRWIKGQL